MKKNQNIYVISLLSSIVVCALQGPIVFFHFYLEATVSINMFALHLAYTDLVIKKNAYTFIREL